MSDILERVKAMPGALTTVSLDPPPRCTGWRALCMFARCQFRKWGAMARAKVRLPRPARGRGVLTVRVTGLQVEDAKSVLTKFRMTGANRVRDRLRTDEGEGADSVCPQLPRARTLMCTKAMSRASRSSVLLNEPTCKYHFL